MRRILILLTVCQLYSIQEPVVYLYILPFENIDNDPTVEWIAPGLSDMVNGELKNRTSVKLKTKEELETIMNDRRLMMRQPRGSRNFLLLGKYKRKLDEIHVDIQLVDISNWQEEKSDKIIQKYSAIPLLNKNVGESIRKMIEPYTPKQNLDNKTLAYSSYSKPKTEKKKNPIHAESNKLVYNLDSQIAELEASMDALLGAKKREDSIPEKGVTRQETDGWNMDFNIDEKIEYNPKNSANTKMLTTVLDQLLNNPYDIELKRPELIYHNDDELYMTVRFPVSYKLKEEIIKDMLTNLPYTGLEQNGSLTIFYFNRESFNFTEKVVDRIKSGDHRAVPIIRIYDKNENILVVIADSPENYVHSKNSSRVLYLPQNQFSHLIEFTVGGWSMQVAMETVEINAIYEMILPVSQMEEMNNINLKFIKENELESFLDPLL
tara:strand:+ start:71 stop:1375 length:1305 start_codon:yes stop_codon:yes gene_type:complete